MKGRAGAVAFFSVALLLASAGCLDESPTAPSTPPDYMPIIPGGHLVYQLVDDQGQLLFWSVTVRDSAEATMIVEGDTLWAAADSVYGSDYYNVEGQLAQTQFMRKVDGLTHQVAVHATDGTNVYWEVYRNPLRVSPSGSGPGETWSTVTRLTTYTIDLNPPPTVDVDTTLSGAIVGRVLRQERISVPAPEVESPLDVLLIELLGYGDSDSNPDSHQYMWLANGIGPVRTVDLTLGETASELSSVTTGKFRK